MEVAGLNMGEPGLFRCMIRPAELAEARRAQGVRSHRSGNILRRMVSGFFVTVSVLSWIYGLDPWSWPGWTVPGDGSA